MKTRILLLLFSVITIIALTSGVKGLNHASNISGSTTGCSCHSSATTSATNIYITGIPDTVIAGRQYTLSLTIASAGGVKWGFDMGVGTGLGTFTTTNPNAKTTTTGKEVHHNNGAPSFTGDKYTFDSIFWTAPLVDTVVKFSYAGMAANGNGGTSGDKVYKSSFTTKVIVPKAPGSTTSTTNASICFGKSYLFNGTSYNTSGSYTVHLINSVGADSAATLNLKVSPAPKTFTNNLTGCNSIIYKGVTYTSSTILADTVRSLAGCDSIYNIANITISCSPAINSFAPAMGKTGDTILIKGANFSAVTAVSFGDSTAKSFVIVNDSTIKAVVGNGASGNVTVMYAGGNFPLPGFVFNNGTAPGLLVTGIQALAPFITPGANVLTSISNGIGILELPKDSTVGIIFGSKGAGIAGWAADGATATYNTAVGKGEWVQFAISPAAGYDLHIAGFNIAGFNSTASTANVIALAYSVGDTAAFSAATCTFLDSTGVTGINPPTVPSSLIASKYNTGQNITILNGTTLYVRVYMWRHNAAASSSQFAISDFTVAGTSSATSGGTPTSSTTYANICYGNTYLFNGTSYSTSGTYVSHLTNHASADSAATLMLTVSPAADNNTINLFGCSSVIYKNVTYTSSTVISDTVKAIAGCDSIYNNAVITVSCLPTINSFAPLAGKTGDTILISGANFNTTTAVTFGDTAAKSFVVVNDSTIKAIVGNGATGNVTVTNTYGSVPMPGFTYKNSNTGGLLVTGLQVASPFITAGNNMATNITVGTGILELPKDTTTGLIFGTKAAGIPGWAGDGTTATFNTANTKGEWIQFEVSPAKGYNAYVSAFNMMGNNSTASTANYYAVAYANGDSTLFGKGTCSFLNPAGMTGNNAPAITNGSLLADSVATGKNIMVADGTTMYIRVYMWRKNAATSSSQFTISDFTVNGTTSKASSAPPTTSTTNANIGAGSYTFNGTAYSNAGTYTVHLSNVAGADSAAVLHLTVNPGLSNCIFVSYNNVSYFSSAVLRDTVRSINSADSIYNVTVITINPTVVGNVITPKLLPIPNAVVTLKGNSTITNTVNGNFNFSCLAAGSNDTIKVAKNNDVTKANGVTALDIALLQSHILGKTLFTSPYKIIAADVNGDKKVTALDIVYMKRLILGIDTTFTITATGEKRLWAFVDSSYSYIDQANPFPYKDSIMYTGLNMGKYNQTFIGFKLGDVNWDWNPAVAKPAYSSENAIQLSYDAINSTKDNTVRIPIRISNFKEIAGMQFTVNFDADKLIYNGINNNVLNIDLGTNHAKEGKLTFLWNDANNEYKTLEDGSVIMELVFDKIGLGNFDPLTLDGSITKVEAFDKDYLFRNVVLNAKVTPSSIGEQWVVSPNPAAKGIIRVQMQTTESKSIVFRLTDNTGRVVMEQKKACVNGRNSFDLMESKLLPVGVYYLHANGIEGNNVKTIIIQ